MTKPQMIITKKFNPKTKETEISVTTAEALTTMELSQREGQSNLGLIGVPCIAVRLSDTTDDPNYLTLDNFDNPFSLDDRPWQTRGRISTPKNRTKVEIEDEFWGPEHLYRGTIEQQTIFELVQSENKKYFKELRLFFGEQEYATIDPNGNIVCNPVHQRDVCVIDPVTQAQRDRRIAKR